MNSIPWHSAALPTRVADAPERRHRKARKRAAVIVAALNWVGIAVVAFACAGAAVSVWLRLG